MSDISKKPTKLDTKAKLEQFARQKPDQKVDTVQAKKAAPAPKREDATETMLKQYQAQQRKNQVGLGRGRLLFASDNTASRAESWALASKQQADMLRSVANDTLELKVMFFRGQDECNETGWTSNSESLARAMQKVECVSGMTQIKKVLEHALAEEVLDATIFIGDAMEEKLEELAGLATELGRQQRPVFMFLEGKPSAPPTGSLAELMNLGDPTEKAFRLIAEKSGGEFFWFGIDSVQAVKQFTDTLIAVADAVSKAAIGDDSALRAITHKKEEK